MNAYLHRDIRQQVSVLIERWADGGLYVIKNRFQRYDDFRRVPYQIHPNEAMKLMSEHVSVAIVNWDVSGHSPRELKSKVGWYNLCSEVKQYEVGVIDA